MTWLRTVKQLSMNFFKTNTTGLQGRDLISVNFSMSEYECFTCGKVKAGSLDCYKSARKLWIWSISWFSRIFKDPPLSKIRKFQQINEIKRRNGNYVENLKINENHQEILRRKAVVDCFDCCESMPRLATNRGMPTEASFSMFNHFRAKNNGRVFFKANMTWFGALISIRKFFLANMTWLRAGEPISMNFF